MDDGFTLPHFIRNALLVAGTVVLQAFAQLVLDRLRQAVPPHRFARRSPLWLFYVVACVAVLLFGHIAQVFLWAAVYFHWGEVGNFASSVYFSLASFTTVGASDLVLSPAHRITGALEAAIGMLMFGWSTALLVRVVQRTEDR